MRPRTLALSALIITLIIVVPMGASAQEKRFYGVIKGGIYTPTDSLDDIGFDTGFNGEIGLGYYLSKHFALEFDVGYFKSDLSKTGANASLGSFTENGDIWVVPVTINGKFFLPYGPFEFFLRAGLGVYYGNYDSDFNTSLQGLGQIDDSSAPIGFNAGLGANYNITESLFLGLQNFCKCNIIIDLQFFIF